jgi:2,3-bisphosphoglycerate-independent phosphoglycerate mutase
LAGFNSVTIPECDYQSDLDFIFENIEELQSEYNFIYAHVKKIDESGHDGDFQKKKRLIEAFDKKLEMFRNFGGIVIVTSDHVTSTEQKAHMPGAVPLLVYGKGKDSVKKFDEFSVKKGRLKNFTPAKLWKYVFAQNLTHKQ